MKRFLFIIVLCFTSITAQAAPQLGISPCIISAQPADLTFSGSSATRQMSTCGETVIAFNNSSTDARFRLGTASTTTALTTDLLLPSKTFIVLNVGTSGMYFAAIGSGGGTISFVQGTAGN